MLKEIQQPTIEIPDLEDPFSWALISRVHSQWLKHVAPQLGLDAPKVVLGDVLASIIGDDSNAFSWQVEIFLIQNSGLAQSHFSWNV